jgi:hypothetical protein
MGAAYGQPPSTWADIGDPDLSDEYDEAAHDVGTQIERLQSATVLVKAPKRPKNAPQMIQEPKFTNEQINWVLGFVLANEPDDEPDADDLYDRLLAGLDDQSPHA